MKYIIAGSNWAKKMAIYKIKDDNMLMDWLDRFPNGILNYSDDKIIQILQKNKTIYL